MKVILINAAGTRTEHEYDSAYVAMGEVGPKYPVIVDGRAGHFEHVAPGTSDPMAVFVETDPIFWHFRFNHLPEHLQAVSRRFYELAEWTVLTLPRNAERTAGLRKLIEAKDCAVRAALTK